MSSTPTRSLMLCGPFIVNYPCGIDVTRLRAFFAKVDATTLCFWPLLDYITPLVGYWCCMVHCTGMHTCFVMVTCSKLPTRSTSTWLWPCRCIPIVRIISRRTSRQLSPCSQYRFGVPHLWFRSRPESPFALGGTLTLVGRGCFMRFGNHCILLRFAYLVRNSSHCILDHTEHSVFHYLSICRVPNGRIPSHSGRASTSRYLE